MIPLRRKYSMSDGMLIETTNRVLVGANRDVAQLTNYSIDQPAIDAIALANEGFSDLPTDIELSSMMGEATLAKNTKRKEAADYIMTEVMMRVSMVYGQDSRTYQRFGVSDIYNETDGNFYILIKRVKRQATALQTPLAAKGLTATHITTLGTFTTDFDNLWEAQDEAIDNRDQAVTDRIEAGNALYAALLEVADLGKQLWDGVDESKYNDYVLYPNQTTAPQGQVVETSVPSGQVVNLSLTALEADMNITAENLAAQGLFMYFAASPTDLPTNTTPGADGWIGGNSSATSILSDAGYLAGVREYANVYNPGPNPGSVRVTVV